MTKRSLNFFSIPPNPFGSNYMVPWKVELNQSTPFLSCDQPFYKEERTSKLFITTFKNLLNESKIYLGT
jgi:hypothetical protein